MSKRDDKLLVDDIIQSFRKIQNYTNGISYDNFLNSDIVIDAVIRNFEIAREASNYISNQFKLAHPHVQWQLLTDFRNKLIHHYFGVDYEIVWNAIKNDIDKHLELLEIILQR